MLLLKPFTEDHGRSRVRLAAPPCQFSCASWVFHPPTRIHVRLLGPCFKTGRLEAFRQRPDCADPEGLKERNSYLSLPDGIDRGTIPAVLPPRKPTLTSPSRCKAKPRCTRTSNRFPLNNFKHCLTLFSKFFSSFPHGTCSLSVSRQYLALDGIYHLLWAAFPNNPTLRQRLVERMN